MARSSPRSADGGRHRRHGAPLRLRASVPGDRALGHRSPRGFAGGRRREALPYPSMSCAAVNATELS
jgi:hypothetical protein